MIPAGAVVTYVHPPGRLNRAVVLEPGSPRSVVLDEGALVSRVVPTHWLADTHERVALPDPPPTCEACVVEATPAAGLFAWEQPAHTCRLRGAA